MRLNEYELGVSEVCYIGDSINDFDAAQSTGLKFIGLCSPYHNLFPNDVLSIDHFKSLIDFIASENKEYIITYVFYLLTNRK